MRICASGRHAIKGRRVENQRLVMPAFGGVDGVGDRSCVADAAFWGGNNETPQQRAVADGSFSRRIFGRRQLTQHTHAHTRPRSRCTHSSPPHLDDALLHREHREEESASSSPGRGAIRSRSTFPDSYFERPRDLCDTRAMVEERARRARALRGRVEC